jgi:hypothetical protein
MIITRPINIFAEKWLDRISFWKALMNNHVAFFVGVLVDVHLDGLATIQMSIVKIQKKKCL